MNHFNPHNLVKAAILAATIVVTVACNKEKDQGMASGNTTMFSEIRLPVSQVPFFANLSNYDLVESDQKAATRSEDGEETVTLEELLDRSKTKTRSEGGYNIVQIAFKQNEKNVYALLYPASERPNRVVPTRVKKFLISATSAAGEKYEFVSVLITSVKYAAKNPDFDFFEKPGYTGAIFFCSLEGELIQTNDYTDGRILGTKMLTPEESETNSDPATKRIVIFESANTRSDIPGFGNGWEGFRYWGGVCVDFTPLTPKGGGGGGTGNDDPDVPGGDGSAPPGTTLDRDWDNFGIGIFLPNTPPIIPQMYQVKLTSNTEGITMTGGGVFEQKTLIHINYSLDYDVLEAKFTHWTGTFRLKKTVEFDYMVTENVESTAYFNVKKAPCHNAETNLTNPLSNMSVAPTDSGNYLRGLYHKVARYYNEATRDSVYHWGLDLAAPEGTPIYAAATGRIVKLRKDCPKGKKGKKYNGRFGNEIIVACEGFIEPYADDGNFQDLKTVYMQYAHLQYGNAIAFNYREGRLYQENDMVYAGEIIGYTGRTGNAWNVAHPHLHYGISFDGDERGKIAYHSWIDPADFINGEIDLEQLNKETKEKVADGGKIKTTDCY